MESTLQNPALVASKTTPKPDHRLLDRHRALLPADELHRLHATAPAAGGGGVVLAAATGVLWGPLYFFWRRLQATPASGS
jgi:hypothetical protein